MKTDTIFYQLFQEFPQIFFELIAQPNIPTHIYQFIAPEIKQASFRLDGIFSPPEEWLSYTYGDKQRLSNHRATPFTPTEKIFKNCRGARFAPKM